MTLCISYVDLCIDNSDESITDLVVENQVLFSKILADINKQINGITGDIILSENDKIINFSRKAEVIWNPIIIDINSQKIVKKLYQEIQEISDEFEDDISNVNSKIVYLFDVLSQKLQYNIIYEYNMDISSLLKAYKVQFESDYDSLAESLLDYVKTLHQLCGINVFFTVNIKDYFDVSEINEIYKFCLYEKINLINISSLEKDNYIYEKKYIIDQDLCIINTS